MKTICLNEDSQTEVNVNYGEDDQVVFDDSHRHVTAFPSIESPPISPV